MHCDMYMGAKLLEHAIKIVEKVLEKSLGKFVMIDDVQLGFMPGKGTIVVVFILRRIQEKYLAKQKKLYMCFVDQEKAFDRVPREVVEWAMRKKCIPEPLVFSSDELVHRHKDKSDSWSASGTADLMQMLHLNETMD